MANRHLSRWGWNAIFWCNHDQPRVVSRFGDDSTEENRQASAKMLAIVLHMLQGHRTSIKVKKSV